MVKSARFAPPINFTVSLHTRKMLAADSPLRRLPADLPRRQVLFTDALRLSAEVAGLSYDSLEALLRSLVGGQGGDANKGVAIEAIADAYSVVDAANRFREVLRVFPSLKQNEVFKLFIRQTAPVETLRDVVQHLNGELANIAAQQSSALGTITWLGPSPHERAPPTAWILQPGSFYPGQATFGPMMDLEAYLGPGEVRQIHLVTSDVRVNLSDVIDRIRTMIRSLEPSVREHSGGKELLGSDVLMHFEFTPKEEAEGGQSGHEG